MNPPISYLGLGSNMGDRLANITNALAALEELGHRIIARSSIYETPALLPENAPPEWDIPFFNMVVGIEAMDRPEVLLAHCKAIEQQLGRIQRGHWGPREVDVDILTYGELSLTTPHLTIPHQHMHCRAFVLLPLAEIAPDWQHPVLGINMQQMIHNLSEHDITSSTRL